MHLLCVDNTQRRHSQPLETACRPRGSSSEVTLTDAMSSSTHWRTHDTYSPSGWSLAADFDGIRDAMKDNVPGPMQRTSRSFSGMSDVARTFHSRLRRASTSLKSSMQNSSNRPRNPQEAWTNPPKPLHSKRRASDTVQVFRESSTLGPSSPSFMSRPAVLESSYFSQALTLDDRTPGAAARAWAAKENERLGVFRRDSNQASWRTLSGRESGINLCEASRASAEGSGQKSGESQLCRKGGHVLNRGALRRELT